MVRPFRLSETLIERVGVVLWSAAALVIGLLLGSVVPGLISSDEDAPVRMKLPDVIYETPLPDGGVVARNILAGAPPRAARTAVVATVRACLDGPFLPDAPVIRASRYPWNRCACLAAEAVGALPPHSLRDLAPTFARGVLPPDRLDPAWIEINRACTGLPSDRFIAPRRVAIDPVWR
jgi:hypothetical protein